MSTRKGMALILTLVMAALIGTTAMLLFSTTNTEVNIQTNVRRINQAKISAASGLNHFIALGLNYAALRGRASGASSIQIVPATDLSTFTSYEVFVYFTPDLNEGQYVVESIGYYKKRDKVVALHKIKSLFDGRQ